MTAHSKARRRGAFLAALALLLGLAWASTANVDSRTKVLGTTVTRPTRWMATAAHLNEMTALGGASLVQPFFDSSSDWVLGPQTALPVGWKTTPTAVFQSAAMINTALANGLAPGTTAVMYDNEHWTLTPTNEQLDPAATTQQAATAAHTAGITFVAAPAVTLVTALRPGFTGNKFQAYLDLNLAGSAAKYADVLVIQAQGAENDKAVYTSFVRRATTQARAANPSVIVVAGLSTGPTGHTTTAQQLAADVAATRGIVDGFWINIPRKGAYCTTCTAARPDIAVDLFRLLGTP